LGLVYHSGKDHNGHPIICIAGCRLPDPLPDMDKLTLYLLRVLDPLVNSDYVLVYFHSLMSDRTKPDFSWLKDVYSIISWKYSTNLRKFYVVHPTFWLKLVNIAFKALTSSEFLEKVEYLDGLTELFDRIPRTQLNVHPEVYGFDKDENGVLWTTNSAANQHSSDL